MLAVVGVVLLLAGAALAGIGVLGWRGLLPRNRVAGVRTPATLRSDEAFTVGNRVAGPPVVAAGAVAIVGGALALGGSVLLPAVAGVGALVLLVAGGLLGNRAAAVQLLVPAAAPVSAACSGCACLGGAGAGPCGR